jgi:hypothetical protein
MLLVELGHTRFFFVVVVIFFCSINLSEREVRKETMKDCGHYSRYRTKRGGEREREIRASFCSGLNFASFLLMMMMCVCVCDVISMH